MYGLIGGPFPFGLYYSRGLDVLADKIRALKADIEVLPTFGFSEWKKIAADIPKQPKETGIVIYGHSMGANQAAAVARAVGQRNIDLLIAFDPTIWYPVKHLGTNVRHALWFHGTNFFSVAGHGRLKAGPHFEGKLEKFSIAKRHEIIDDHEKLHDIVLKRVAGLRK